MERIRRHIIVSHHIPGPEIDSVNIRNIYGRIYNIRGIFDCRVKKFISRAENFHHLPQWHLEVIEETADGFEPEIERQSKRIMGFLEFFVCFWDDVLRFSEEFGRGRIACVMPLVIIEIAVSDVVFQNFIHNVNVRQDSIGVLAGERQVRQVRAALDEEIVWFQSGLLTRVFFSPLFQEAFPLLLVGKGIRSSIMRFLPSIQEVFPVTLIWIKKLK